MKIAVISTHIRWKTHYETELEIMQRHIDEGDQVVHIVCNGDLLPCDQNMDFEAAICYNCIHRRWYGATLLSEKIETIPLKLKHEYSDRYKFSNEAEVKSCYYKNFDIGYGALSTLISSVRNPVLGPSELEKVNVLMERGRSMYDWMEQFIDEHKPDQVYVFNGRFIYNRAVLRVCQAKNVKVYVHERGHDIYHYELYLNTTPHDILYIQNRIIENWEKSPLSDAEKHTLGEQFFIERKQGIEQSWYSFTKHQEKDRLPENWDPKKNNVVIFNSSEDEFASIGGNWRRYIFSSQTQGIQEITEKFVNNDSAHFYLRVHPNLTKVKNPDLERLLSLAAPNLSIVYPDSKVSTYAMIEMADKVITFGSTVGIEATFWGRPSILLGSCFYRDLGVTYNPETEDELFELIAKDLAPKPIIGALKYAYYLKTYGIPFIYYKAEDFAKGRFKNKNLGRPGKSPLILRLLRRFSRYKVNQSLLNAFMQ